MSTDGPILICFDGSDDAKQAIETAGKLLGARPAVVLTVWQPAAAMTPLDAMGDTVGRLSGLYAEMDSAGAKVAADHAADGARIATEAGFEARPEAREGAPTWAEIVRLADEVDAAAVLLGARGRGAVKSAILGSVSTQVLHHCRRPVLVVTGKE